MSAGSASAELQQLADEALEVADAIERRANSPFSLAVRRRRRRVRIDVRSSPEPESADEVWVAPLPLAVRQRSYLMLQQMAQSLEPASDQDATQWRAWVERLAHRLEVDDRAARAVYGPSEVWR